MVKSALTGLSIAESDHWEITYLPENEISILVPEFSSIQGCKIKYGNGEEANITQPATKYKYQKSGEYQLSLTTMESGKEKIICSKKIHLKPS